MARIVLFAFLLALVPRTGVPGETEATLHRLHLQLSDELGGPSEGRITVLDQSGTAWPPQDPSIPFYSAWSGHEFFYARDTVSVLVPTGATRVLVSRGPEFHVVDTTIAIYTDTVLGVDIRRAFDLRKEGWYSGDTHVHLDHGGPGDTYDIGPEDYALIARSEDLAVSCLLTNGLYFTPGVHPAGDADHLLHFAVEYRSSLYGHLNLVGISTLPSSYGCCLPGTPAVPLNLDMIEWTRQQGGTAIYAHPLPAGIEDFMIDDGTWPYSGLARELGADLVCGGVDALDVFSYSNAGENGPRELWFDALNTGERVALSVGTDAAVNRNFDPPVGGYRLYVKCDPLSLDGWLSGLKEGCSFATNGPLLVDFRVEGVVVGGTLDLTPGPHMLQGSITVYSREPVTYLDVQAGPAWPIRISLPAYTDSLTHSFSFPCPQEAGFVVVQVAGPATSPATVGGELVALSSPVWITYNGTAPPPVPWVVDGFEQWVVDLQTLVLARTGWDSEAQKMAIWNQLEAARLKLSGSNSLDVGPEGPESRFRLSPNPWPASSGRLRILVPSEAGRIRIAVFDVSGRRIRKLASGADAARPGGFSWDGRDDRGRMQLPGVYYVRASSGDWARSRPVVLMP